MPSKSTHNGTVLLVFEFITTALDSIHVTSLDFWCAGVEPCLPIKPSVDALGVTRMLISGVVGIDAIVLLSLSANITYYV